MESKAKKNSSRAPVAKSRVGKLIKGEHGGVLIVWVILAVMLAGLAIGVMKKYTNWLDDWFNLPSPPPNQEESSNNGSGAGN